MRKSVHTLGGLDLELEAESRWIFQSSLLEAVYALCVSRRDRSEQVKDHTPFPLGRVVAREQ